jgi:myxalamid-type polyketide synthase MxaB
LEEEPEEVYGYTEVLGNGFACGIYSGLPRATDPLDLLKEAFQFFQEAKHIGKVVLRSTSTPVPGNPQLFNTESTYLITGGLGRLGLAVTEWIRTAGARNFVLVCRSISSTDSQDIIDNSVEGREGSSSGSTGRCWENG